MLIPLGCSSRNTSSCLPESDAGSIIAFLFGIAPDKAFLATPVTGDAGGLLHHHFTLAHSALLNRRFVSVELALPCDSFPLGSIPPCGVRTFLCAHGTANICSSPCSKLICHALTSIISFFTAQLSHDSAISLQHPIEIEQRTQQCHVRVILGIYQDWLEVIIQRY